MSLPPLVAFWLSRCESGRIKHNMVWRISKQTQKLSAIKSLLIKWHDDYPGLKDINSPPNAKFCAIGLWTPAVKFLSKEPLKCLCFHWGDLFRHSACPGRVSKKHIVQSDHRTKANPLASNDTNSQLASTSFDSLPEQEATSVSGESLM